MNELIQLTYYLVIYPAFFKPFHGPTAVPCGPHFQKPCLRRYLYYFSAWPLYTHVHGHVAHMAGFYLAHTAQLIVPVHPMISLRGSWLFLSWTRTCIYGEVLLFILKRTFGILLSAVTAAPGTAERGCGTLY